MAQLDELILANCEALTAIPAVAQLTTLKKLDVSGCSNITDLNAIDSINATLTELNVSGIGLKNFDYLANCAALTKLTAKDIKNVTKLHGIITLSATPELDMTRTTVDSTNYEGGSTTAQDHINQVKQKYTGLTDATAPTIATVTPAE